MSRILMVTGLILILLFRFEVFKADSQHRLYLVQEPIASTVSYNSYALPVLAVYQLANTAAFLYAGALAGGVGGFAFMAGKEAVQYASFPLISTGVLKYLADNRWELLLAEIGRAPGIEKAHMITSANAVYRGPIATQMIGQGYLFLRADHDLSQNVEFVSKWGSVVEIQNSHEAQVTFSYDDGVSRNEKTWTMSVASLLANERFPLDVVQSWRAQLKQLEHGHRAWDRYVSRKFMSDVRIEAVLKLPDGRAIQLEPILSGSGTAKFLATSLPQRLTRAIWPATPAGDEGKIVIHGNKSNASLPRACARIVRNAVSRILLKR